MMKKAKVLLNFSSTIQPNFLFNFTWLNKSKDVIKERNANYKKNTNYKYEPTPEKKKEYARRANLKKKDREQKKYLKKFNILKQQQ